MKGLFGLFMITLMGCSSINVKGVDKDPAFALSNYKTFSFYEVHKGGDAIGPQYQSNLKLLQEEITKQLGQRGLTLTADNPDLLVNIGIVVTEKVQTRETSFANPGDRTAYMGQRNYSWQSQEVEVGRYREGTVTVHLVDRAQNKLMWKGSADTIVPEKQKNVPASIKEGMTKLFESLK
jgi:hypothetical protein